MKKILKILFTRDILLLIIVNLLLADTAIFSFFLMFAGAISREFIYIDYALMIMTIRLFVLPIFYNLLKKYTKNKCVQDFLYKLRYSIKTRLLILILSPIPFIIECLILFRNANLLELLSSIIPFYILSLFCGLFGSYLVLFLYWYIEDKIKNFKNRSFGEI